MLGEIPDVTIRKISLNFDLHQNLDLYFHGILNLNFLELLQKFTEINVSDSNSPTVPRYESLRIWNAPTVPRYKFRRKWNTPTMPHYKFLRIWNDPHRAALKIPPNANSEELVSPKRDLGLT